MDRIAEAPVRTYMEILRRKTCFVEGEIKDNWPKDRLPKVTSLYKFSTDYLQIAILAIPFWILTKQSFANKLYSNLLQKRDHHMKAFILNGLERKDDTLYEMISDHLKNIELEDKYLLSSG